MPEKYLYAQGTCGVCGFAGGLVIASTTDPRCFPCEDWAAKLGVRVRHLARARELAVESLAPAVLNEAPPRQKKDPVQLTQAEANGQAWRPMCKGFVGHHCLNRTVDDGEFCRRHGRGT